MGSLSLSILLITDWQIWYVYVGLLIIYGYVLYYVLHVANLIAIATIYIVTFVKKYAKKWRKRTHPLLFLQYWSQKEKHGLCRSISPRFQIAGHLTYLASIVDMATINMVNCMEKWGKMYLPLSFLQYGIMCKSTATLFKAGILPNIRQPWQLFLLPWHWATLKYYIDKKTIE